MKNKKLVTYLVVFTLLVSTLTSYWVNAEGVTPGDPISPGTYYEKVSQLTSSGWSNINIARSDLSTEGVNLTALVSNPINKARNVLDITKRNGAYVGVNASFFSWNKEGVTSIGPVVKNGVLYSSSGSFNSSKDTFASIYMVNGSKSVTMGYLHPYLFVRRDDGKTIKVNRFNTYYEGKISVYNNLYSDYSPGKSTYKDTVEIIVEDGIMKKLRIEESPTRIPVNGFVISAAGYYAGALVEIYEKGRKLDFDGYINPPPATPKATLTPTVIPTSTPIPTPDITDQPNETTPIPSTDATTQPDETTPIPSSDVTTQPESSILEISPDVSVQPDSPNPTGISTEAPIEMPLKFSELSMCVPGGALIVKKGNALTSFSHMPIGSGANSLHPRTALGVSKDGKNVFLITVDGRQSSSVGISMLELATYMKSLGAYTAINLDGGGSSTMVTRQMGTDNYELRNSPCDSLRNVGCSIGITYDTPSKATPDPIPVSLKLNTPKQMFINTAASFKISAWNNLLQPMIIKKTEIVWKIGGIEYEITDNVVTPKSVGIATITAEYRGMKCSGILRVIDRPVEMNFNSSLLQLVPNREYSIPIYADSADGFRQTLNSSEVTFKSNIGVYKDGKFTVNNDKLKTGYILATYKNVKASLPISVRHESNKEIDSFGKNVYSLKKTKAEGKLTLKKGMDLSYSFPLIKNPSPKSSLLSLTYKNGGMKIAKSATKISLDLTTPFSSSNNLTLELKDSKKKIFILNEKLDWIGRKNITFNLPEISGQAKVTKITLSRGTSVEAEAGSIHISNLKGVWHWYPSTKKVKLPASTVYKDPSWVNSFKKSSKSFVTIATDLDLDNSALRKVKTVQSKIASKTNSKGLMINNSIKGYSTLDYKDTRAILLDTSRGGILQYSKNQWRFFTKSLASAGNRQIIIFMNLPPEEWNKSVDAKQFYLELQKYYEHTKHFTNLVAPGDRKNSIIINGSRRISIPMLKGIKKSKIQGSYLEIKSYIKEVCYRFKSF